jgi:ribosome maturation factor RimP
MQKDALIQVIGEWMSESPFFLVDVQISTDNEIVVEFESESGMVTIDNCVELTEFIESKFDRDVEDYALEVGSAGLGQPFKVLKQYEINIDNEVEVLDKSGKKIKGILKSADKDQFVVGVTRKIKIETSKKPVYTVEDLSFSYDDVKSVRYILQIS